MSKTQSEIISPVFQIFRDAGFHVDLKKESATSFIVRVFSHSRNEGGALICDFDNLEEYDSTVEKRSAFRAAYNCAVDAIIAAEKQLGKSIII